MIDYINKWYMVHLAYFFDHRNLIFENEDYVIKIAKIFREKRKEIR